MTITTRTVACGIPPRLHQPKPTKASSTKAAKPKQSQKRVATESDEDESSSDESELRVMKKQCTKQQNVVEVSDDDVDVIEDNVEPAEKDIKDVDGEPGVDELQSNEQEVSTDYSLWQA